jgi:hypothetical protein
VTNERRDQARAYSTMCRPRQLSINRVLSPKFHIVAGVEFICPRKASINFDLPLPRAAIGALDYAADRPTHHHSNMPLARR